MEQYATIFTVISKTQTTNENGSTKYVTIIQAISDNAQGVIALTSSEQEDAFLPSGDTLDVTITPHVG